MRPGQIEPTDFEIAILQHLAQNEPPLHEKIENLHVLSREFTGVGCFTNFSCDGVPTDASTHQISLNELIHMPGVPSGLGATLFCKGGRPQCLEVFAFGNEYWDGVYEGFVIEQVSPPTTP